MATHSDVKADDARTSSRRALTRIARPHRRWMAAQVVLSLTSGLAEAFVLITVTRLAVSASEDVSDVGLPTGIEVSLAMAAVLAAAAIIGKLALNLASSVVSATVFARSLTRLRRRLARAFFRADWDTIASERLGDLQTLITGHASQAAASLLNLSNLALALGRIVVILVAALVVSPLAALIAIVIGATLAVAVSPFTRATKRHARRLQALTRSLNVRTTETTRLSLEARTFGVEEQLLHDLDRTYAEAERSLQRGRIATLMGPQVYQNAALFLIVAGAAAIAAFGSTDLADFGASLLLLLRAFGYAQGGQAQYQSLVQSLPFVVELLHRLDELEDRPAPDGPHRLDAVGDITFDRVSFRYDAGPLVLDDVSFTIEAGETVGIVGPSGAGKSTLIQLLLGLRLPTSGRLLVGGLDLSVVRRADLHRRVAYVPQEPRLLTESIGDNLRFFRDLSDEDLRSAIERADVRNDIDARAGGLDSSVGAGGAELSGGQRQRLTIARALAGDPDVLILDEPTSAVDERSDQAIQDGLRSLRGDVTIIVITHRTSTLDMCDRVLELDGSGTVTERSTDEPGTAALTERSVADRRELRSGPDADAVAGRAHPGR